MSRRFRGRSHARSALVIAGTGLAFACTDYGSYGPMQAGSSGGAGHSGTGGAGGEAKDASGSGGRGSGGEPREASPDTTDKTPSDAHDAGDGSSETSTDADAAHRDVSAPFEGGNGVDAPDANGTVLLTFDQVEDFLSFRFFTPSPNNGMGIWAWVPDDMSRLPEVRSYMLVVRPSQALGPLNPSGTHALYEPGGVARSYADVCVSVHIRSDDPNSVGIVLRYVDQTHFYRLWVAEFGWDLARGDGDTMTIFACGGNGCAPATPYQFDHSPGHKFTVSAIGNRIRAWVDGVKWADVSDSTYPAGEIGLYDRGNIKAEFDDFTVGNCPELESVDGGGMDGSVDSGPG